jgi:periplasmic copper chaperone A
MSLNLNVGLLLSFSLLAACGPQGAEHKSGGAAMPTPTVSAAPTDMPAGTQMAALSMINAKVKKPIDGRPTAGYLVIENDGPTAETITAVSSPDFARVELHDHVMDGAMKSMVKLTSLEVPGKSQIMLAPGGKHLMLFDATRDLKNGDSIKVTFTFSNSGPIETNFVVLKEMPPSTSTAPAMHDPMAGHDMSMPPKQ